MTNIVPFPEAHCRASAQSRAAKAVNLSEVTPAERARSVDKIADHLSAGMLSRCHHLETVVAGACTSDAKASFDGHRPITSRKEQISHMHHVLGPSVLKRKDNLALDGKKSLGHNVHMADSEEEDQYKQEFMARVKSARIASGRTQKKVAVLLDIEQDYYKQWETRSLMPHRYMEKFCIACGIELGWLVTGKGQKPRVVRQAPEVEPITSKPKKTRRSRAA